jgi:hypothetical protein
MIHIKDYDIKINYVRKAINRIETSWKAWFENFTEVLLNYIILG